MKARDINTQQDKNTNSIVFKKRLKIFRSMKCFGKIIVQYSICRTGNKKLIKNIIEQNKKADRDFLPFKTIGNFDLNPPFEGRRYCAFFLDKFSSTNKPSIKISK